jgi:hypothetical protein
MKQCNVLIYIFNMYIPTYNVGLLYLISFRFLEKAHVSGSVAISFTHMAHFSYL